MEREKEQKNNDSQVISPLANEKTYGERMYTRVFDWGLNYWTNLLASAGFSQWAEHSVRPFRIPLLMKNPITPRDMQQSIASGVRKYDYFFKRFANNLDKEMAGSAEHVREALKFERSMARARSLTLLIPGFFVTIPSVWLGAKFKPALVEWWNKRHYGEEAMDDPSLKARHEAIAAEARPTLLGAIAARIGTVFAAQATAQMFGSNENWLQKMGAKHFKGIDPFTNELGSTLGGTLPKGLQRGFNRTARGWGYDWSLDQRKNAASLKLDVNAPYSNATQDLARFIAADTIYTAVTAATIRPIVKLLPHTPIIGRLMSYSPKAAANAPTLDGDKIKVPANRYADEAPDAPQTVESLSNAAPHSEKTTAEEKPVPKVQHVQARETLAAAPEPQRAGAVA